MMLCNSKFLYNLYHGLIVIKMDATSVRVCALTNAVRFSAGYEKALISCALLF